MGKYSKFEEEEYFIIECLHCGNRFLTGTLCEQDETRSLCEPEEDGSFQVFCPCCGKKVTSLASEKVTIGISEWPKEEE
jgi:hypothetical protein